MAVVAFLAAAVVPEHVHAGAEPSGSIGYSGNGSIAGCASRRIDASETGVVAWQAMLY